MNGFFAGTMAIIAMILLFALYIWVVLTLLKAFGVIGTISLLGVVA